MSGCNNILRSFKMTYGNKLFFFISGIIASVPITLFISSLGSFFCVLMPLLIASICATAIVAPLVEEFAKAYPFFYRYEIMPRSLMTLAFLTGLGFGIAEFFIYVFGYNVPFFFRIHPIFFHASSASIVAYGISQRSTLKFYSLAVILHFLNNFFATLGYLWLIGGIGATIMTYYLSYRFFRILKKST